MQLIPLAGIVHVGRSAIVDDSDYEWLSRYHWACAPKGEYAIRYQDRYPVRMHREIMGCVKGDGLHVDHRNHNPLDNRRENLRVGTHQENQQNRAYGYGRSAYRGVSWHEQTGKWRAYANVGGRQVALGLHRTEIDAARAAQQYRFQHMPHSIEEII